jgi:hypothetical protein
LRTLRTNFDRNEQRRDRRHPLPRIVVSFGGASREPINWSLGGFLLASPLPLDLGAVVAGTLRIPPATEEHEFTAELVRREAEPHTLGFQFLERSPRLVGALDRALARRMVGRGR